MGPFEVNKDVVQGLSDEALRLLLAELLAAEAQKCGIPSSSVVVGGNQTAGDGGVDASINWKGLPRPREWLPRRTNYFQCKAETMAASALKSEMRPKGKPRRIFAELANCRGAYIVFSTDDVSKTMYERRIEAMKQAVAGVERADRIALDFYGAERIARWTNRHLGVAIWLLEQCGRPLRGWRPYGPWSTPGVSTRPYLFDDTVRADVNGADADIATAINSMRSALCQPGSTVRLVGISGMGKTRIAEALFDDCVSPATVLPASRAVYADAGLDLPMSAALMCEQLVLSGVEAVVVIDNCSARTHSQLAEIVRRPASRTSLLTIDFDVGEQKPDSSIVVTLSDVSEAVLTRLLEQRHPALSEAERRHLAEFSGGNARIALKIAESAKAGVDLSKLNDGELLDRLFQTGRQDIDQEARRSADAASLVYAFYVEVADGQQPEHPLLAQAAGVSADTFYRHIATFLDWGTVQQRGPQRAVMPPPLANMLASTFIRRSDPSTLLSIFIDGPPRLLASFARRIGYLHAEPAAVELANRLIAVDGVLGNPAQLDTVARRSFIGAAPASPEAALYAIERTLVDSDSGLLTDPTQPGRRDYAQLLAHIAYEPKLFGRALEALLKFVIANFGPEEDRAIHELFLERFWIGLSFTMADRPTRLAFIDRLLDDADQRIRALGLEALDHMLEAGFRSSWFDPSFGSRPRLREWQPIKGAEFTEWFASAYERAERVAVSNEPGASRARAIVANHFRQHLEQGVLRPSFDVMRRVAECGFWGDGWCAVSDALHYTRRKLDRRTLAEVEQLEKHLRPRTIEHCFEAFVLGEPWRHWHPAGREAHSTRNVSLLARAVGRRMGRSRENIRQYLERATVPEGSTSVQAFGEGLSRSSKSRDQLWRDAYAAFRSAANDRRRPDLLVGILKGAASADQNWTAARLNMAVTDSLLAEHLIALQSAVPLDEHAMVRFTRGLDTGVVAAPRFALLMSGGATKTVPAPCLASFLRRLFREDDGVLAALQVLHMRIFGDVSADREVAVDLIEAGREFLADPRVFSDRHDREDHAIAAIAKIVLNGEAGGQAAAAVCRAMRFASASSRRSYLDFRGVCEVLMRAFPRVVLDEVVAHPDCDDLVARFFDNRRDDTDAGESSVDESIVFDWVNVDPESRAYRLAQFVPFAVQGRPSGVWMWSSLAVYLIDITQNPEIVLGKFEGRFMSGPSSGSFSSRLARRRPIVASLLEHRERRIRVWARAAQERLEANIRSWDALDRGRDSRFE